MMNLLSEPGHVSNALQKGLETLTILPIPYTDGLWCVLASMSADGDMRLRSSELLSIHGSSWWKKTVRT